MEIRYVLIIVSYVIYLTILATLPLRVRFILKQAGEKVLAVKKRNVLLQVLIIICCAVMIGLLFVRDLGTLVDLVICFVSILGVAMGSEEIGLNDKSGVYQNGLIGGGHFLPLKEIFSLPATNFSSGEQYNDPSALRIITDKKGTVTFVYSNKIERDEVVRKLVELSPKLNRD